MTKVTSWLPAHTKSTCMHAGGVQGSRARGARGAQEPGECRAQELQSWEVSELLSWVVGGGRKVGGGSAHSLAAWCGRVRRDPCRVLPPACCLLPAVSACRNFKHAGCRLTLICTACWALRSEGMREVMQIAVGLFAMGWGGPHLHDHLVRPALILSKDLHAHCGRADVPKAEAMEGDAAAGVGDAGWEGLLRDMAR